MMRAVRFEVGTLAVALVVGTLSATPVQAQMLRCQSQDLSYFDRARVIKAAARVLTPGSPLTVSSACSNFSHAKSWVQTNPVRDRERVSQWQFTYCQRRFFRWSCEQPQAHRELEIDATVSAATRHLVVEFDAETPVQTVRMLSRKAVELVAERQAPLALCEPKGDLPGAWVEAQAEVRAPTGQLNLSVSTKQGVTSVFIGSDTEIRFRPNEPGSAVALDPCSAFYIVVT